VLTCRKTLINQVPMALFDAHRSSNHHVACMKCRFCEISGLVFWGGMLTLISIQIAGHCRQTLLLLDAGGYSCQSFVAVITNHLLLSLVASIAVSDANHWSLFVNRQSLLLSQFSCLCLWLVAVVSHCCQLLSAVAVAHRRWLLSLMVDVACHLSQAAAVTGRDRIE